MSLEPRLDPVPSHERLSPVAKHPEAVADQYVDQDFPDLAWDALGYGFAAGLLGSSRLGILGSVSNFLRISGSTGLIRCASKPASLALF
jgi:hypothetical protein